jgi:methyltransferase-like protein 6
MYFDNDFDFNEHKSEWESELSQLPPIKSLESYKGVEEREVNKWDEFYHIHNNGQFFKPRKYLSAEFEVWLNSAHVVLEVGCGYGMLLFCFVICITHLLLYLGCSIFPLMKSYQNIHFIASDYSDNAIKILRGNNRYDSERITSFPWNIISPCGDSINKHIDCVLAIFVLSALPPQMHSVALANIISIMPSGSVFLFRDYGIYDMTMFRHVVRYEEHLYERTDGTLCYYFSLEYLIELCAKLNLEVVELKYATVNNVNKKKKLVMKRVFVHGVFRKI